MVTCPAWVGGRIRLLACVPATASATSHIAQAQGTTHVKLFCTLIAATILTEPITMAYTDRFDKIIVYHTDEQPSIPRPSATAFQPL